MKIETNTHHQRTYSSRLLNALTDEGFTIFTVAEAERLAKNLSIPAGYVTNLLMLMVKNGWIARLRRDLYVLSGPMLGASQIHHFAIAARLVTPSSISHWSALHHHGLTEQIPRVVNSFTPRKVITPSMRKTPASRTESGRRHAWIIDGVSYEYSTVKKDHFFGIEDVWINEFSKVSIMDKERTVLESLISVRMFGGIGEALGIIERHLHSLQIDKLVEYACRYGKISVARRLGWVLEQAGTNKDSLTPLLKIPSAGYHLLDPTRPNKGKCDRRWMIQVNLI